MNAVVFSLITTFLDEPVMWLFAAIGLVLLLVVLRPRQLGARGEAAVGRRLRRYCDDVANDLIIRDGRGGLTQIDHLALTSHGLLVVETKDFGGLVFGQAHDQTWTQCIGTERHKFENPLRQNYGHVKAVQAIVPGVPVSGLVVFTDRAQFPNGLREGATTLSQLPLALPLTSAESICIGHRDAWDVVLSHVLTDRLSRQAHLVLARRRKLGG